MACFIFDGVDYGNVLDVESVDIPAIPATTPNTRNAPSLDGAALVGNPMNPFVITVKARLATDRTDPRDIQRKLAEVVAGMRTDGPRKLSLTEGLYRMAVLHDETPIEFRTYSGTVELKFLCTDPIAYGDERTVTVPSGGSATFTVEGTYPAKPKITANAVRNSTSLVWGLKLDDGDYIHVATGSASARSVALDCKERTCVVNGTATLATLDSDWLELAPGKHTLAMDNGTGAATVTFSERWL